MRRPGTEKEDSPLFPHGVMSNVQLKNNWKDMIGSASCKNIIFNFVIACDCIFCYLRSTDPPTRNSSAHSRVVRSCLVANRCEVDSGSLNE